MINKNMFIEALVKEGFPLDDAISRIENSVKYISELKQNDPLLRIIDPFNEIPGIIENLDNNLSLDEILLNSIEQEHLFVSQSKNLFRYFDFWSTKVNDETINKIIESLIDNINDAVAFDFALYSDKVLDDPSITKCNQNQILKLIKIFEKYVPFIATTNINKLKNKKLFGDLNNLINIEKRIQSDDIKTIKYSEGNHLYCLPGRKGHHNSLVEPNLDNRKRSYTSKELYDPKFAKNDGKVTLIYYKNKLIGSIKIRKNPNFIGLRNIQNSSGNFPTIIGGVYGIRQELEHEAQQAYKKQGKYAKLNINQIELYPISHIVQKEFVEDNTNILPYSRELILIREKIK